jgi:RNA polymerase sigma factor (sigma-70 family)
MSRAVRQATGSVRFTAERRDQLRRLAQARAADPAAGPAALGVAAGIGEEDATTLVPFLGAPIPLDAETDRGRALEELLADRRAEEEMEEVLVSAEVMHLLNVADRVLTPRQREVLEDRYGLGGRTPKTLREVAERLGVSVQRVYQIERSALDRLRAELARPD